ncbi:MAG: pyridoxamine 5'-phosphate oxidase [Bacteroidia bacterium]
MSEGTISERILKLRNDYAGEELVVADMSANPVEQFEDWMEKAIQCQGNDPNAMVLATAGPSGIPSSRVVLLRGFGEDGFNFFTNYASRKSKEIEYNPQVSLAFYWPEIMKQVRIEGKAFKLPETSSDEYFNSRPRESQIGAWASLQSDPLESRQVLEKKYEEYKKKFEGKDVPRPGGWGGFTVKPFYFEFWQGRANRLHDRIIYQKNDEGSWTAIRLSP